MKRFYLSIQNTVWNCALVFPIWLHLPKIQCRWPILTIASQCRSSSTFKYLGDLLTSAFVFLTAMTKVESTSSVLSVVLTLRGSPAAQFQQTELSWRPLVVTLYNCTPTTRTPIHTRRPWIPADPWSKPLLYWYQYWVYCWSGFTGAGTQRDDAVGHLERTSITICGKTLWVSWCRGRQRGRAAGVLNVEEDRGVT